MSRKLLTVAMLVPGLLATAGCGDEAANMSSADALLADLHEVWQNAQKTLQTDNPNLGVFMSVSSYLTRARRRVETDYTGPNKEEVLAKLDALNSAFESQVASKLTMMDPQIRLKSGVTMEQLRASFASLGEVYQALKSVAPGKK